jgi:N-acetylneuraminic acid mutarotase
LNQAREHVSAVALASKIYALGGRWSGTGELTSVEIYDPATDTWTMGTPMQIARAGFGAAVVGGKIVVVGGEVLSGNNRALTSVEIYDPVSDSWSDGPVLPVGLHGVPAIGIEDTLYLIGGSDAAGGIDNRGRVLFISQ